MNLVRQTLLYSVGPLLATLIVGAGFGWKGSVSGALGVVVTDFDILALGLFSHVLLAQRPGPRVIRLCMVFVLLKLPLLIAALVLASRLGPAGIPFFLCGLALVYCAMVYVAIRGTGFKQRDPFS
jgi:hypothetical protein